MELDQVLRSRRGVQPIHVLRDDRVAETAALPISENSVGAIGSSSGELFKSKQCAQPKSFPSLKTRCELLIRGWLVPRGVGPMDWGTVIGNAAFRRNTSSCQNDYFATGRN